MDCSVPLCRVALQASFYWAFVPCSQGVLWGPDSIFVSLNHSPQICETLWNSAAVRTIDVSCSPWNAYRKVVRKHLQGLSAARVQLAATVSVPWKGFWDLCGRCGWTLREFIRFSGTWRGHVPTWTAPHPMKVALEPQKLTPQSDHWDISRHTLW